MIVGQEAVEEAEILLINLRCMMPYVMNVVKIVRCLLGQAEASPYIAVSVSRLRVETGEIQVDLIEEILMIDHVLIVETRVEAQVDLTCLS